MSDAINIYIAYRRVEGKTPDAVHRFADQLKESRFVPVLDAGRLSSESDWLATVRSQIENCDVVCVMVGAATGGSDWIKQEIQWAQDAGIPLLPVVIEDSHQVAQVELEKLSMTRMQYVSFASQHANLGSLLHILDQLAGLGKKRRKARKIILDRTATLPNYSIFGTAEPKPIINRILGNPSDDAQYSCDVFVIMPFKEPFNTIYRDHIKPIAQKYGLAVKRGDDFFSTGSIMSEVWSAMFGSYIVIAECTGRNPNVFYELGMAHTLNKPGILITQSLDDIPFDIRHLRHIQYEYTPPSMTAFERNLEKALVRLLYGEEL